MERQLYGGSSLGWRERWHNATRVAIEIDELVARDQRPPRRFARTYRRWDRHTSVWVLWPLAPIVGWWARQGGWYAPLHWALALGLLRLDQETDRLTDGHWRWPWTTRRTLDIEVAVAKMAGRDEGRTRGYSRGWKAGYEAGRNDLARELRARLDERHSAGGA